MFDDIETVCRAAACLTHADGRNRYVFRFGVSSLISTERPQRDHVEIRRSGEIHNLVTGTAVRPCPNLHPAVINGIIYTDADGRWARDNYCTEYLVFDREAASELVVVDDIRAALWQGNGTNWSQIELHSGFVVRATAVFQVGADLFTLLEDADGDEFLVEGVIKLCSAMA